MKLLTVGNPKTVKGERRGYLTAVLHLAPHTLSGRNVCPMATAGCAAACLNTAGRGGMGTAALVGAELAKANTIQRARVRRTNAYFDNRAAFMLELERDIESHVRAADRKGLIPCVRLNGTSDIRWENMPTTEGEPNLMEAFPFLQFYDYTKLPNRRGIPPNYHLTYSLAEGDKNWRGHLVALENGMGVAVVLRGAGDSAHPKPFPPTWNGRALVDGDESDLRFLDPPSVYVGLRAKGRAKTDTSGFVHDLENPSNGGQSARRSLPIMRT